MPKKKMNRRREERNNRTYYYSVINDEAYVCAPVNSSSMTFVIEKYFGTDDNINKSSIRAN